MMPLRRQYGGSNTDALIALVADRLAAGSPQGSTGGKTGAKYTGYDTATEQKQAVLGLGGYRRAQDLAVQQMIADASDLGLRSEREVAQRQQGEMENAYSEADQRASAPADASWDAMAANYAGKSAQEYNAKHPPAGPPPRPPAGTNAGSYGAGTNVFQGDMAAQAQPAPSVYDDPTVRAAEQAHVSDTQRLRELPGAQARLATAQTRMGEVGKAQRNAYDVSQAQDQAVNDLMYGDDTQYKRQAALEMGIDPLVAWGMFPDQTPSQQLSGFGQERDLVSIDKTGMPYSQAQAATKADELAQTKAEQEALDQIVQQSTGLSAAAAQSRSGLTAEQINAVVSKPGWSDLVNGQDQLLGDAQGGDQQALSDLEALLVAPDLSIEEKRLLRARMQGLGITDTELEQAAAG
jgi:hypothetical protein